MNRNPGCYQFSICNAAYTPFIYLYWPRFRTRSMKVFKILKFWYWFIISEKIVFYLVHDSVVVDNLEAIVWWTHSERCYASSCSMMKDMPASTMQPKYCLSEGFSQFIRSLPPESKRARTHPQTHTVCTGFERNPCARSRGVINWYPFVRYTKRMTFFVRTAIEAWWRPKQTGVNGTINCLFRNPTLSNDPELIGSEKKNFFGRPWKLGNGHKICRRIVPSS